MPRREGRNGVAGRGAWWRAWRPVALRASGRSARWRRWWSVSSRARRRVRPLPRAVVPHPGRVPALVRARGLAAAPCLGGHGRRRAPHRRARHRFASAPPAPPDGPRSPTTWCVTGAVALPPACCGVLRQVVVRLRLRSPAVHGWTNSTSASPTVAAGCGCGPRGVACAPRRRGSGGSAARGRPPGAWTVACSPFATRSALSACSGPARSACTTSLGRVRRRGPPLALGSATRPGRRSTTTAPTARPPATLAGASAWATGSRIAAPPCAAPAPGGVPLRRPAPPPDGRAGLPVPAARADGARRFGRGELGGMVRFYAALPCRPGRTQAAVHVGRARRPRWRERGQGDGQGGRTSPARAPPLSARPTKNGRAHVARA